MILVLFGTNPYSFDRLAIAIEKYARETKEEIIVQLGNTKYLPKGVKCFRFLPRKKILQLLERADIIITQGGFGSIVDALSLRKPTIVVPRKRELNECKDDGLGQEEVTKELEKMGLIIAVYNIEDLPYAIEKAKKFKPKFDIMKSEIPKIILNFVKKNLK